MSRCLAGRQGDARWQQVAVMLQPLGVDLWCLEGSPPLGGGAQFGRTSVVRLASGDLLLHAPPEGPEAIGAALESLGRVRYLLAPNLWTALDLAAWRRQVPELTLLAPAGWSPSVPSTGSSRRAAPSDRAQPPVAERLPLAGATTGIEAIDRALELRQLGGLPRLSEWLVRHPASRSLLVGDLVRGCRPHGSVARRLLERLTLGGGPLTTSRDVRWLVADRAALRASLQTVFRWSFDRVVPRHGALAAVDAERAFRHALRWLDGPGAYWQ